MTVESISAVPASEDPTTHQFVAWVRGAAPYIHAFRGKTFVVGFGGEVAAGERGETALIDPLNDALQLTRRVLGCEFHEQRTAGKEQYCQLQQYDHLPVCPFGLFG